MIRYTVTIEVIRFIVIVEVIRHIMTMEYSDSIDSYEIIGWKRGARQGVGASFKLDPVNQGVGVSFQLVLVKSWQGGAR